MLPDDLKLAVDLYKDALSTVHTLWGLYSVAAFALLGYILAPKEPVPGRAKLALGVVFLIFALSNAHALWESQGVGYRAVQTIKALRSCDPNSPAPPTQALLCSLELYRPALVVIYQLFFTAIALTGLYIAHRRESWLRSRPAPK